MHDLSLITCTLDCPCQSLVVCLHVPPHLNQEFVASYILPIAGFQSSCFHPLFHTPKKINKAKNFSLLSFSCKDSYSRSFLVILMMWWISRKCTIAFMNGLMRVVGMPIRSNIIRRGSWSKHDRPIEIKEVKSSSWLILIHLFGVNLSV